MTDLLRAHWTERKDLQPAVVAAAMRLGWLVQHSRNTTITRKDGTVRHATAITGHTGYPDLTLARNGRIAFLELKSEKAGPPSHEQVTWLAELCGGDIPPNRELWRSRGEVPDGAAFHLLGGWTPLEHTGDWRTIVAVIRPRHYEWLIRLLTDSRT